MRRRLAPSRMSLRLRVTLVFVVVMSLVLAAIGSFLFLRTKSNLDDAIRDSLRTRAGDLVQSIRARSRLGSSVHLIELGEEHAQVLTPSGRVIESEPTAAPPLLSPAEAAAAARHRGFVERPERTRLLAIPARTGGQPVVAVVAASLADRENALETLGRALLIGGPMALLLASTLAYGIASAALRPVELMRRRASEITAADPSARLPVPVAEDEIRRLALTLNEMLGRLAVSAEQQRAFVANASHELRTPLAAVRAELELALRHASAPEEFRAAAEAAIQDADALAKLADDLMTIARGESGAAPLERTTVDVPALLEKVADEIRPATNGRPVTVTAAPGSTVEADEGRLTRALENMARNAVVHGSGAIVIGADGPRLWVRDEGPPLPDEQLARVFERFARGSDAGGRPGAGLGLAIVRDVAAAHGGSARLENVDGGVRCTIELPDGA